ncbi:DUF6069 family protein [Galbitalea sp. SE-J8]|nr:DUF6069 family protein [Galbitalea sp. SE-J8]MDM4763686.1 DUF6069 family protein [Galbitalea sp. SE-J8]
MTSIITSRPTRRSARRPLVIAVLLVAMTCLWSIAVPLLDIRLRVTGLPTGSLVTLPMVLGATLAGAAASWGLLVLFERNAARGRTVWRVLGTALLLASLLGPISLGATPATTVALLAMHVLAGVALLVFLPGARRRESAA